ncbi:hypothetical protein LOZ07_000921 [Ophidiomyces ophidiicola]|nr:hypothetical protein LOZ59_001484 [Ophidiomyces ophidiicola]KAI2034624.1 hypothetical protein LOZ48_001671 [Ophidiomyces ophidiicola]KAI2093029.1 hypothetical protein LOZ36_000254 [Ophidiomyces ophidiicola]KAI2302570.1 hypothetical protein LOZ07_000921 [Ophidiomyces ophidiicola]KAI2315489.1 hypothetical protein LOZ06_000421 [Ophidiomyces ophidiicola]
MSMNIQVPCGSIVEEDQNPDYNPKNFYPTRVGETIQGKYRIISKLGFGTSSTTWLAKDTSRRWRWQSNKYVALKITNSKIEDQKAAREEVQFFKHISNLYSTHAGSGLIRRFEESFEIQGPFGAHVCLVFEPMREPIWFVGKRLGCTSLPPAVAKAFVKVIVTSLDFLHSECHIIHTDLKSDNFLLAFEDSAIIEEYVRQQEKSPAPFKDGDGHPVYQSRPDFGPLKKGIGKIRLSDFGAAVFGNVSTPHSHDIQPFEFTAPEVLLRGTWTYSADIWNLGMMLWELLADTSLLNGIGPGCTSYSHEAHLGQMIRLLGPLPLELLNRADKNVVSTLFSDQGDFKYPHLVPSEDFNFSTLTPFFEGEDKRLFLNFAKRMLTWMPEERATAKELLDDPWLDLRR